MQLLSVSHELMRVAWRGVGAICERLAAEAMREVDLLAGRPRRAA